MESRVRGRDGGEWEKDLNERAGKGRMGVRKWVRHTVRERGEKKDGQRKNERCAQKKAETGELPRLSLTRAELLNVSISEAPLWLKIESYINRHWSDSYCLKDKMAAVYLSHLFYIANIIYLNQNDSKPLYRWWDFWLFVLYFHLDSCIPTTPSLTPGVWGIVTQGGNDITLTGQVEIAFWFWLLTSPLPG